MKPGQFQSTRIGHGRANPSVKTLQRYAAATGTKLRISFDPASDPAE